MNEKIKVFEAFAGIGTQRMALRNLGIEHEVVGISEIDKYAIQSYQAIHGETMNFGDISKINPNNLPDFDLFTYSFPCQDLSVAGKQQGIVKGQTRSGLLYECEKIIETKRPKYLLLENVKNLVGKSFRTQFEEWLAYLESLGYTNYWQVLNAKHYGVPQNRERVFVVSILGEHQPYEFPQPIPLTRSIKDILEPEVEDKYYINKPFKLVGKGHQAEFLNMNFEQTARIYSEDHVMRTLSARDRGQNNILVRAQVEGLNNQNGRVYDLNGICATLDTMQGGHRQPKVLEPQLELVAMLEGKFEQGNRVYSEQGISPTVMAGARKTCTGGYNGPKVLTEKDFRVRKLMPIECWRLMGISDEDFYKTKETGMSNTQLYKQAGNAIVVPVLEMIFKNLFIEG